MKPIELHLNLPFSYWQEKDPRTGSACIRPEPSTFAVLLRSFYREMAGMKEDYEDCQVTAIRFLGGYLSLFDTEDLEKLFAVIHQCFSVKNVFVHDLYPLYFFYIKLSAAGLFKYINRS